MIIAASVKLGHSTTGVHDTFRPLGARMSQKASPFDPRTSVLNQFQQAHDVGNLFVMDGASFVSSACQNPTLTIMALAVRSCDHLLEEMKRGNV